MLEVLAAVTIASAHDASHGLHSCLPAIQLYTQQLATAWE
jgi:hypothetical protein